MKFFLGTHKPHWLADDRFAEVPLFISRRTLSEYKKLPVACTEFALDSGGFTELQMHGRWSMSSEQYADEISVYIRHYRDALLWVSPQDWMCEPIVINGGDASRGVRFAGTGLSVHQHQELTVSNFVDLCELLGDKVIPVLQGWNISDYHQHQQMYHSAGVKLEDERVVGVGSICRRQATDEAVEILNSLANDGLRLQGFGIKSAGLTRLNKIISSADSMAWSDYARRGKVCLPGHDKPGLGRKFGHKSCQNCAEWALTWRHNTLLKSGLSE